jgi:hypothetical protein
MNYRLPIFFHALVVLSLAGCATTALPPCQLPKHAVLPSSSTALQVITISSPNAETRRLLASVHRAGQQLDLSLLDGVLQVPLAHLKLLNGRVTESELLAPIGPGRDDLARLAESLDRFYEGKNFVCSENHLLFSDGPLSMTAREFSTFPGCFFPRQVEVVIERANGLRIEVITEEITCGS